MEALRPGTVAPDFTLPSGPKDTLTLSSLRGSPVVLVFYPEDWSPVCTDQMALYEAILPELETYGARLLGISTDGKWCHRAFAKDRGITYPLLADFEPKGEVARRYGVYREDRGYSQRALFVVDEEGVVRWSHVSDPDVNPGAAGFLRALEEMRGAGRR